MRRFLHGFIGAVLVLAVALPAAAATPSEFYLTMLRRGVSAYDAGRYDAAVGPLKIAAFGLLDSIDHYQIAQAHLALTHDRMGNAELSREAAHRLVVAERIQPRYASIPLSAATRANFESLARRVLTAADQTVLGRSAQSVTTPQVQPPAATNPKPVPPAPVKTEPVVTKPQPAPVKTEPAPVKPEPVPVKPEPAPVKVDPPAVKTEPPPVKIDPPVIKTEPAPQKNNPPAPRPQTTNPPPTRTRPPANVPASFTAAEQALNTARLVDARAIYRELLDSPSLERSDLLRLAEGFYRARDFANALRAFEKIGPLRRGEEPFRYYIAVALYETAQYQKAKEELAAVLPFIEQTPDVTRYRLKIEGAVN